MTQTTFTDNVLVDGSQDTKQLRVQGHTTQTQPLQTWENSGGTPQAQVSGDGNVQIGDDLLGWSTPDALLEAHRGSGSTNKPKRGFHSLGQVSGTLNALVQWIVEELELRGSTAIDALHTALRIRASNMNTGTPTANAELRGADIEVINDASAGAAALTKATGLQVAVTNALNKIITEAVGIRVKLNNAGTITNPYAIYVEGIGVIHFEDYLEMKRPGVVPGKPPTDVIRIYGKDDGKLYAKNWIGANGEEFDLTGSGGAPIAGICNGRLTLSSGVPVPTADVLAATSLYFTPFRGNQVALYNGSAWALFPFTERSLSLSGLAANTPYDIFLYDNAGTLTLEAVAWNAPDNGSITSISNTSPRVVTVASHTLSIGQLVTITGNSVGSNNATWRVGTTTATTFQLLNLDGSNSSLPGSVGTGGVWQRADQNTARATALAVQDGVYVKSGALGRRYLGTIRTTSTAGQTEDSAARRFLWNYTNRVLRKMKVIESTTTWAYTSAAWRGMHNTLSNRLQFVCGVAEDSILAKVLGFLVSTSASGYVGIGEDAISTNGADVMAGTFVSNDNPLHAEYAKLLSGYHFLQALEYGGSGINFWGTNSISDRVQTGIVGELWA